MATMQQMRLMMWTLKTRKYLLTIPLKSTMIRTIESDKSNVSGTIEDLSNSPFLQKSAHLNESFFPSKSASDKEIPRPNSMLNTGPAKQPVTAISPNPFFVIATFAFISPRQFPTASRVSPSSDFGIPRIKPMIHRRSTTKSEVNAIHTMDITKPKIAKMNMMVGGGCVLFVQKQR